ncbi:MAG: cadherin repeat domain-containing protein, partial [Planctomycetes bacterium]|nr:cadherin repeat domain-containing protein [Planctomycetota bacterium]
SYNEAFLLTVTDQNEAPTDLVLDNTTLPEDSPGAVVGNVTVSDADVGDTHTFTVDDARFEVVGGQLRLIAGQSLDYESEPTVNVTITVTDSGGLSYNEGFTITVTDQNEAPTVSLANIASTLDEDTDTSSPLKVADIVISDDALGSNGLALTGADAGLFEIVGMELRLRAGATLNRADNGTLDVTVEVDDTAVGATPDDTARLSITVASGAGPGIEPPATEPPPEAEEPPPEAEEPPPQNEAPPPDNGGAAEQTPVVPRQRRIGAPAASSLATAAEARGMATLEQPDFSTLLQRELPGTVGRGLRQIVPPSALAMIDRFVAPFDVSLLSNDLYDMAKEMNGNGNVPLVTAGSAAGFSSVLSVGYVLWTIRGGWLATSLLAQMPAWRLMDPLVVLAYLDEESEKSSKGKQKDEDDSLESLLESSEVGQEQPENEDRPDRGLETSGAPQGNRESNDQP